MRLTFMSVPRGRIGLPRMAVGLWAIALPAALCWVSPVSGAVGPGPATQPTTLPAAVASPTPADVDALVKQLGADAGDDRDAAQRKLVDLGPAVVPALERAAASAGDPEVRSRAAVAVRQIHDRDNDASLVTLHVQDAPAQSVLDAIGAQAHAKLVVLGFGLAKGGLAARTLTVDADRQPFWAVMVGVCEQLNVCPMMGPAPVGTLRLCPAGRNWMVHSPHQLVGPYWVSVGSLTRVRTVDLTAGPQAASDFLAVQLTVLAEPKIALSKVSDPEVTEVADDVGHSLLLPRSGVAEPISFRPRPAFDDTVNCRLLYPSESPGSRLAVLRGSILAVVLRNFGQYEVDDVLGHPRVVTPMDDASVQATVAKEGAEYHVTLECGRGKLTQDRWSALTTSMGEVSLTDQAGHPLRAAVPMGMHTMGTVAGLEFFRATGTFVQVGSAGGAVGEPKRLSWTYPRSSKAVGVPFVFKDLPLP